MKYLIVGLGNIGTEYRYTRHNIGFIVLDAFAEASNITFTTQRYGDIGEGRIKNKQVVLLKPSTYMNLSGDAVAYWMKKENIPLEQVLVVVDDLALPFGVLRLKGKGSDAGHNGLKDIAAKIGTTNYARLRFGIGNDYPRGMQVEFVLGHFLPQQEDILPQRLNIAVEAIKAFCLSGITFAMNNFNNNTPINE